MHEADKPRSEVLGLADGDTRGAFELIATG